MKSAIIYELIQRLYAGILRDIIVKAVDDPDSEWDEFGMNILDKLMGYED